MRRESGGEASGTTKTKLDIESEGDDEGMYSCALKTAGRKTANKLASEKARTKSNAITAMVDSVSWPVMKMLSFQSIAVSANGLIMQHSRTTAIRM